MQPDVHQQLGQLGQGEPLWDHGVIPNPVLAKILEQSSAVQSNVWSRQQVCVREGGTELRARCCFVRLKLVEVQSSVAGAQRMYAWLRQWQCGLHGTVQRVSYQRMGGAASMPTGGHGCCPGMPWPACACCCCHHCACLHGVRTRARTRSLETPASCTRSAEWVL